MGETNDEDEKPGRFPIVGLGASAGGLEALEELFSNMPAAPGLAFVVVTHQHPGRPSLLAQLIGRKTDLPVDEVTERTVVERDHVYVCAPGYELRIVDGELRPVEVAAQTHPTMPIDHFLRALAEDQKDMAVAVILSGTGSDGTLGIKEIKAELGMVMVQEEATARYGGMPHSAITTETADFVLPAGAMAAQLVEYAEGLRRAGGALPVEPRRERLGPIFAIIRDRTGHDFAHYKDSTVRRRIARRMNVHHVQQVGDYVRYLREHPTEIDLLFKELLIGVTSFFRDPEAWESFASGVRELLESKPGDSVVRAWVPGCSTGEEAYSLAIVLREALEAMQRLLDVQIFATDLDATAIDVARAGVYPAGIASDVPAQWLGQYFIREGEEGFRVRKDIREMLVFAPQNVIADPPFTKLDILCCRNLLIYLDAELQQRLLPLFHYALKPGGVLFLGSSESLGAAQPLFEQVDKRWKVYRRREVAPGTYVAELPAAVPDLGGRGLPGQERPSRARGGGGFEQLATKTLLADLVPPTVLVRERGDVVYVHGRTGRFLEPAPGAPETANVFNMAREGLQMPIAAAMRQAAAGDEGVVRHGIPVKTNGGHELVDLKVKRLEEPEALKGLLRVSFEVPPPRATPESGAGVEGQDLEEERVLELERELQYARESHQGTIEELETANEELKSTNEELQSTNEELQSTNEELETSKEEMQSLNEELQTVNAELQEKIDELSRANDDMKNLLDGTDIATVFLDEELHVKRFTEQARHLIRLIPSDVGRPIADIASNLRYDELVDDCRQVLRSLAPAQAPVRGEDGSAYLMRILPYRTSENVIDGLVLTFVDITPFDRLREEHGRLLGTLQHSHVGVMTQDRDLEITWASTVFGRKPEELVGSTDADLFGEEQAEPLVRLKREVLASGVARRETVELTSGGRAGVYDVFVEPTRSGSGEVTGLSSVVAEAPART